MTTPELTPEQVRFNEGLKRLWAAESEMDILANSLPPVPESYRGISDVTEIGYYRTAAIEFEDDKSTVYSDGYEDFSERGNGTHVMIDGVPYAKPDGLAWD